MAIVLSKKSSVQVPSSSEEDDLLTRSSKKIKNGGLLENEEEWPKLGLEKKKQWESGPSFAEKLKGIHRKGEEEEELDCENAMTDDTLSDKASHESDKEDSEPLCVVTEDPDRNFPKFSFSGKMKKRLYKAWNRAVIVKLLGRNIGYMSLLSILQSLWAKRGVLSMINIGNGFFVVKLSNREDYFNALTGGPWMLFDHYLTVRPWEPQFQPRNASISKVAVWVRVPNVSLEYYDRDALTWIGNRIGETIKIDINTSGQLRGHYARICVLVNLDKQLMSGFSLDGEDFYIEYEGLHWLCSYCGIYGHKADSCKTGEGVARSEARTNNPAQTEKVDEMTIDAGLGKNQDTWRVVQKMKKQKRGWKETQTGIFWQKAGGSRYGVLAREDEGEPGGGEVDAGGSEMVGRTKVVEGPRIVTAVRNGKERKGGMQKKQLKSIIVNKEDSIEFKGRHDQRKEKRTREMVIKEGKSAQGIRLPLVGPTEETEVKIMAEHFEVPTDPLGMDPLDVDICSPPNLDPGEPTLAVGPRGKFWVGPDPDDPDCEMVLETPGNKPDEPSYTTSQ